MQVKLADVKRAYAAAVLAKAGTGNGTVVVLPEFMEDNGTWVPTEAAAIDSPNSTKGFGYVALVQYGTVALKGVEFENYLFCIQRGRTDSLSTKYTPGMILPGRIVTEDSLSPVNAADPTYGLKFASEAARIANIPCTIDDQPIYQLKYWDRSGEAKDSLIQHNNDVAALVAKAKPSAGMDTAKAARIAELKSKTSRTKAEKLELAELED